MEFTLLGAALVGMIPLGLMLRYLPVRDAPEHLADVVLTGAMVGLFVGRLAAMLGNGVNPLTNPGDILIVRSGVATGWATVAAIAWVVVVTRPAGLAALDAAAPAALVGLGGWHAGCLVRDACLGTPTGLPWGMRLAGSEVARHPTELYAALLLGLAGVAMWLLLRRRRRRLGVAAGLALAVAAVVRLATEPLRPALGDGPRWWYVAGIAIGLLGAAAAGGLHRRVARPTG
jgi:prolipoprotein diacylglyceryltransferase